MAFPSRGKIEAVGRISQRAGESLLGIPHRFPNWIGDLQRRVLVAHCRIRSSTSRRGSSTGQRTQHDRIHDAENRGVRAYPESEREHCSRGESFVGGRAPQRITNILRQRIPECPSPNAAALLTAAAQRCRTCVLRELPTPSPRRADPNEVASLPPDRLPIAYGETACRIRRAISLSHSIFLPPHVVCKTRWIAPFTL